MSEPTTLSGLLVATEDGPVAVRRSVPLTGVRIHTRVQGPASRVSIVQSYLNRETVPLEAVYVFPLEEGSAVCAFAVTIDGKRLEGQVLEREAAFEQYDDALADGDGAFLLDQERPNVFTASVGNLMPGQQVDVELSYVAELDWEGSALRLMIPGTISPRYVAGDDRDFAGLTDAERVNPPTTQEDLPYALDLRVDADLLSEVRSVESPSHTIRTEIDGSRVSVTLAGDEGRLDRDFVLLLTPAQPARPLSGQARDGEGERFAIASFRPELPETRSPVELLFLVDCSGSMDGPSIVEARRTLRLCLRSLAPGDRFEIVRFGSSHQILFGESREYDDTSLQQADRLAETMRADLGGTEILSPLQALLARPVHTGWARRLILITDGQVSNENQVIDLARRHRDSAQIYAFGIGPGASEFLVRGVARASRGAAEFVYPGERLEDKVMRHFRRLQRSSTEQLRLDWEGLEVGDVTPAEIPPLFPGETVTFLARVTSGDGGKAWLNGEAAGQGLIVEAPVAPLPSDAPANDLLGLLWARRRIRELEEGPDWTAQRGSMQQDRQRGKQARARKRVEEELVRLGTRYGLLSSATSYVVVEQRDEDDRATERAELRRIPVALTRGWGGSDAWAIRGLIGAGSPAFARRAMSTLHQAGVRDVSTTIGETDLMQEMSVPIRNETRDDQWLHLREEPAPTHRTDPNEPLMQLLLSQNAEGSWDLSPLIAERCGKSVPELERIAKDCDLPDCAKVLATLIALIVLDRADERSREAWRPVLEKGYAWLARVTADAPPPEPHPDWRDWGEQFV